MSDLGMLFRFSQGDRRPLENFTTAALAIAINRDQRPIIEALKMVDRLGLEDKSFPVIDIVRISPVETVSVTADVQRTLAPITGDDTGYLDLVLTVRETAGRESSIWVEVKVDAWESGDQIAVYLSHAERLSPKPDLITLGRTQITAEVPFLRWADVVQAVESVSNPHYAWVSLREFLREEKIVRPPVRSLPVDAAACIEVIVEVNRRIRNLWPGSCGLAWQADGTLRKVLQKQVQEDAHRELLATGGPLFYGLALDDGIWQWCLGFSVAKNYEGIRLDARRIIAHAATLPAQWSRYPDQPELLERRLPPGALSSHDEIVKWFDEGLRQLNDAGVLDSYLTAFAAKLAKKSN